MDKEKNIEQLAAETILERGVRVGLPAPRFFRFFGKKEVGIIIKQPYLGTLLHVSRLCTKAGFDFEGIDEGKLDAAHQMMVDNVKDAARIIAFCVLNSRLKIWLFTWFLTDWLIWKLKPRKLAEISMLIITLGGYQDFTTSIRLLRMMKVTTPKNLSPQDQGSQQAEQ